MAPKNERKKIYKNLFGELDILSGVRGWFWNLTSLLLKMIDFVILCVFKTLNCFNPVLVIDI
jgi:hypothetical protein